MSVRTLVLIMFCSVILLEGCTLTPPKRTPPIDDNNG